MHVCYSWHAPIYQVSVAAASDGLVVAAPHLDTPHQPPPPPRRTTHCTEGIPQLVESSVWPPGRSHHGRQERLMISQIDLIKTEDLHGMMDMLDKQVGHSEK